MVRAAVQQRMLREDSKNAQINLKLKVMATVVQQLWGLCRRSKSFLIASRHSSGLTNVGQNSRFVPVKQFGCHPGQVSTNINWALPRVTANVLPNLLVSLPVIEQRAPPTIPIGQQRRFDLPNVSTQVSLEMPTVKSSLDKVQITPDRIKIEEPQQEQIVEKQAHRMIVIRRRKMKKHQLKKFRKKFRVLIEKRKQKRNSDKETVFLTEVMNMLVKAEAFDPKAYVESKLRRAYDPLPVKPKLERPLPWEFQPIFSASKKKNNT